MIRQISVLAHRWVGLTMTVFLVLVGLTGSLLAFKDEVERWISPELYASPRPETTTLDLAALADRAEQIVPQALAASVSIVERDHAIVRMRPRKGESNQAQRALDFDQLFLDPWSGQELGRRRYADLSQGVVNLIPFIYQLHYRLALGKFGQWILGFVAMMWTIDCFVGFYLTLPTKGRRFWRRWKPAWLIKRRAGAFRLNFDLHRASGLWLWPMLLIFAWSSVYENLADSVYTWMTRAVLDYRPSWTEVVALPAPREHPRLDFRAALVDGNHIIAEQAPIQGFTVESPVSLGYDPRYGAYRLAIRTSRDIGEKKVRTYIIFDGDTGELRQLYLPTGQYNGNTVTTWLASFHMADVFGLPYRLFVCSLGFVVAMLSATGAYIWWKKRLARVSGTGRRHRSMSTPAVAK
jgi:uncharacterized iron-regulated membrane protein